MNPKRPDCLDGDYHRGCSQLAITYRNLFLSFLNFCEVMPERFPLVEQEPSPVKKKPKVDEERTKRMNQGAKAAKVDDTSASILKYMKAMPRGEASEPETKKRAVSPMRDVEAVAEPADMPKRGWAFALQDMALAPERFADAVVFSNERIVAIKDKFPKSSIHLLILPR